MKKIEQVARALALADGCPDPDAVCFQQPIQYANYMGRLIVVPDHIGPAWSWYIDRAKVAIEALREPSFEMLDLHPPFVNKQEFLASYRAMMDAALKE
jgi:hypothetical protein